MSFLAVLYDPQAGHWLRFADPVEELEVYTSDDVLPALQHLEKRVEGDNLYAAGFVSYEASPAFDSALSTAPSSDFPLLHFGLFAKPGRIELPPPETVSEAIDWQAQMTQAAFAEQVAAVRQAIARGETYQVNLTFPLTGETTQEPWQFFLQLVHGQQPTNCGFLQNDRWAICSASPELFFARDGEQLTMRPMKGTAPRGRTLAEDQQRAGELEQSEKNRAENIMILDMVRNDLGRIAPPGAVRAEKICTLEKYPTVWQLTSTAKARSEASLPDIFRALFPCASITGAPKPKTMQIIRQLEGRPRDIYTGTFGWLAPGRQAHFNVAIRTALIDRSCRMATYGIGAGITWSSDSAEEYRECLDKAAVLSAGGSDFALIETLRWTPVKGYFLLDEHLARLQASATYFDFNCSEQGILDTLQEHSRSFPAEPQRVRLLLYRDGHSEVTFTPLGKNPDKPLKIALANEHVNSQETKLFHKTTQRQLYEACLAEAKDVDEVVLWNEKNEITECCTANLVIKRDGNWVTPHLSSGLLPGTYRDYLLKRGVITTGIIAVAELREASEIYLINAVRKWRRATLVK